MRGAPFVLFVVAAAVAGVVFQHGVGDVPVRYQLNRAVVVAQLFLGQNVRTVAVDLPVDADDLLHDAGDRTDVVRHHDDRHAGVQFMQRAVKLLLEFVVHEIRGFVQDQQLRVRDHGPGQQRPLHLPARHLADGAAGRVGDSRCRKQFHRSGTVLLRVAGAESAAALQSRQYDLEDRDRECAVEIRNLRHVADQPFLPAEQLRGESQLSGVGDGSQDGLHERRFSAAVGTYDPQEIEVRNLQVDVPEGLVAVVCDTYVAQRYQIHFAVIESVIASIAPMASSSSGSISTYSASMSRAMISTVDAGNWFW